MDHGLWETYARLQSSYAYGSGMQVGHYGDVGPLLFPPPIDRDALRRVLQIGPGGASEVNSMRRALPESASLVVLTLHWREVDVIHERVPSAFCLVGDMHDMKLPGDAFDLVLASQVMEHALSPYIALIECRRVLRAGGFAWFIMPSFEMTEGGRGPFHLHCLTEDVWRELLRKTGLPAANVLHEPAADGKGAYTTYVCRADEPPEPHDAILRDVKLFKRGHA